MKIALQSIFKSAAKICCTLALGVLGFSAQAQQADRPNILIIMTDQQTADAMSIAGNKDLSTPAMDKLAKNGVRFTKAYCAHAFSHRYF